MLLPSATNAANASVAPSTRACSSRGTLGGLSVISAPQRDVRQRETDDGADAGEQQAFGEELTNQAAAARAHRGAHGELGRAHGAAREQQVGDVAAGDQQHERDRAEQHVEPLTDVADEDLREVDAPMARRSALRWGCSFSSCVASAQHVRARGVDGDAWLQPREHRPAVVVERRLVLRRQRGGDPQFFAVRGEIEGRGHHADHRVLTAAQADRCGRRCRRRCRTRASTAGGSSPPRPLARARRLPA